MPSSSSTLTARANWLIVFQLETAIFQQQLGTIKDKTDRITELAGYIAEQIGADVEKSNVLVF